MADVREKMIELVEAAGDKALARHIPLTADLIADELIANGVTIPEWIPVTEQLPRPFVSVLAFLPDHAPCPTVHECYITADGEWCSAAVYGVEDGDVTHWQPMPQPPKGE